MLSSIQVMSRDKPMPLLGQAHQWVQRNLTVGAIAIDATVGNGNDTVFLARQVAPAGWVYGFDIQPTAIHHTREKLQQAGVLNHTQLFLSSHANMQQLIPTAQHGNIAAIMFNLGYLPGADKRIITQTASTLIALNAALSLLAVGGILTILAYPGHAGGDDEAAAVQQWHKALDGNKLRCTQHDSHQPSAVAPWLLVVEKIA